MTDRVVHRARVRRSWLTCGRLFSGSAPAGMVVRHSVQRQTVQPRNSPDSAITRSNGRPQPGQARGC
ncbi:MAG: hypothetical protein PVJ40_10290, partial [Gammaproteobacteria bacterium]